jgi:antitoxin component YwqK of YwqJK toxin-antitoxin module/sugar lactone lactonase YvrE
MKRKVISILVLVFGYFSIPAMAQDTLGFTNRAEAKNFMVNGEKEGKWVEYFEFDNRGVPHETKDTIGAYFYRLTIYSSGKPIGTTREYINGGKYLLRDEVTYVGGKKDGLERSYYVDGKLYFEIPYTKGKRNGIQKEHLYYGESRTETPYIDDEKTGVEKQYYENGIIHWEIPYSKDKINGVEKEYTESGKIYWEIPYLDNQINGTETEYDTNGKIREEIPCLNNRLNGDLKVYNTSGDIWCETTYGNNKILASKFHDDTKHESLQYNTISTIAGGGTWKIGTDSLVELGDMGPADSSVLLEPSDVKLDDSANVYFVDNVANRIRRIDIHSGIITTIAGNTKQGYTGDNIPATMASLNSPHTIAIDHFGNIYVTDAMNHRVRKITKSTGIISTIAGTGEIGDKGDGVLAINSQLKFPSAVALDSHGNILIGDNDRVREIDAKTGIIKTIVGTGKEGYKGDHGLAIKAELHGIEGLAFDKYGNLYIVDIDNLCIRKVDAKTNIITTLAGGWNGLGSNGDLGPAIHAQLNWPNGIALDSIGNIYIADRNNAKIRRVDAKTGIITTLVGTGKHDDKGDGGLALYAELNLPYGLTIDKSGNLYIADYMNHKIRKVTFSKTASTSPH